MARADGWQAVLASALRLTAFARRSATTLGSVEMHGAGVAKNRSIEAAILRCFAHLPSEVETSFRRKFSQQSADNDQVMHTFRELVLGAYLAKEGERLAYELPHLGLTPDWTLLNSQDEPKALLELANIHAARAEEAEMREHLAKGTVYIGWQSDPEQRLYQALQLKTDKYSAISDQLGVPYAIAIFSDLLAAIEFDEIQEVAEVSYRGGVFGYSSQLAGILYFEENSGIYRFRYLQNRSATHILNLPDGRF